MTAQEHINQAMAHLAAAHAKPMALGARANEFVRVCLTSASRDSRLALERLERGLVPICPLVDRRAARVERGCPVG